MYVVLIVLHVTVSILLVVIVLLQAGRGGGLSGAFGVGDGQNVFGTQATTFLSKATTAFAVIFMVGSLLLTIFSGRRSESVMENAELPSVIQASPQESFDDDLSRIKVPLGGIDSPGDILEDNRSSDMSMDTISSEEINEENVPELGQDEDL